VTERRIIPSGVDNPNPKADRKRPSAGPRVDPTEAIGFAKMAMERLQTEYEALGVLHEKLQSDAGQYLINRYIPRQNERIAIEFFENMDPASPTLLNELLIAFGKFSGNTDLTLRVSDVKTQRQNIETAMNSMSERLEIMSKKEREGKHNG